MMSTARPIPAGTTAIGDAAELFRRARHAVALTGAGISTPSGIPDFRSAGTGLWSHDEPLEVASLNTFRTAPERFFKWFHPLAASVCSAGPNAAHAALAELQAAGSLQAIITQNIDALHQRAGSTHVIEMHGTWRSVACTGCFSRFDSEPFMGPYLEDGTIPLCPSCNAVLKPDVILFGEQLPQAAWMAAQRAARQCDLMLVAGSSLEVLPVAGLPMQALDRGAHLIIVNNTPTYVDARADVLIMDDVAAVLPEIAKRVRNG